MPVIMPALGEPGFVVESISGLLPGAFGPARLAESQKARGV